MSVRMTPVESGHVAPTRRTYPEPAGPDTIPVDIVPPTTSTPVAGPSPVGASPATSPEETEATEPATEATEATPGVAEADPKAEGRQALRAARRQRRRLMIGCAVVITICLALTVAIVVMAGNRSPASPAAPAAAASAPAAPISVTAAAQSRPISHAHHTTGATAPKGANR
jgi:hypothetical protein